MIPSRIPLTERLLESAYEFEFVQAVRLLGLIANDRPGLGAAEHPSDEVVRFEVRQSLQFPPSAICWINAEEDPPRMSVAFFGLTGSQGVLPLYYTEHLIARAAAKDLAMVRFFDLFNHRLLSLFYRAWEKHAFAARYQLAEVRNQPCQITDYLLDFAGLGTKGLRGRQVGMARQLAAGEADAGSSRARRMADESLLRYAGLLAQAPHSAAALEGMLSDFFDETVTVEQCVGAWHQLQDDDRCDLRGEGIRNQLGLGALAGDAAWDPQAGIRVRLGPLSLMRFLAFLPDGDAADPLREITRLFAGVVPKVEWNPILNSEEVPWCRLGDDTPLGPRLGWTAWLKTGEFDGDAQDAVFEMAG